MKNYDKLRGLLQELFQLDRADLDFGIYRIMNQKRDEIVRFLDNDLLPQVKTAFGQYRSADKSVIEANLAKAVEQAQALGVDPKQTAKVRELEAKLADSAIDLTALENEVFSHLYNFFRRYYSEGDFLSLRRYKEGVYAIPYEGEEVKLHWANADQYYVKSSEYLRDYAFTLPGGKRVHFRLVAGSTEQNNNKAQNGKERRFILVADSPVVEENSELVIRFEYRPAEGKEKQADLNQKAVETILGANGLDDWTRMLRQPAPTESNPRRTVLEKHLTQYTARNTFDYFIHKDIGGFLRRELDFYIKNEVMHLDDIEHETAPKVEQYLSQIKVIREIAGKIIQFLAQIENFQKRLWLKKRFVVEANYCITLDRISEDLYPEIAANDSQREEWVRLFGIDSIAPDLTQPGYSVPLTKDFLRAHTSLPVDTAHFSSEFTSQLLSRMQDLDGALRGVLINGDNADGLRIIGARCRSTIRCTYLDPPYNTGGDDFLYKDDYPHSSWMSMLHGRLSQLIPLMSEEGNLLISIDDEEAAPLRMLLDSLLGRDLFAAWIAYERSGSSGLGQGGKLVNTKEHILCFSRDKSAMGDVRYERPIDFDTLKRYNKIMRSAGERRLIDTFTAASTGEDVRIYKHDGFQIDTISLRNYEERQAEIMSEFTCNFETVFRLTSVQAENSFQNAILARCVDGLYSADYLVSRGRSAGQWITTYYFSGQIFVWLRDSARLESATILKANKITDHWSHGELPKADLANEGGVTLPRGKKPEQLLSRLLELGSRAGETVLDFFVGSGTTSAVAMKMGRRFIGIDSESYLKEKAVTRLKNVLHGERSGVTRKYGWNGGGAFKYLRLESYEDALSNLELRRTGQQERALFESPLHEHYILSYMLDVESRGSQSLLNIEGFRSPDEYKLKIERNGESQLVRVDLVETFNWLLGLTVKHIDVIGSKETGSVRVVEGTNPDGKPVLILWRNLDETDSDALDKWFTRQNYSTRDLTYDLIYVNGDNNLENLRRSDQTWKVRLIEDEFQRLMFDVENA